MIQLSVLASSSKGNASLIRTANCSILVDAGISARRISLALQECGLHPSHLDAVLFTHEHGDHCLGLGQLSKKNQLSIYCTRHTSVDLRKKAPDAHFTYIEPDNSFCINDLTITPYSVNHDACDPVGYCFEHNDSKLGYITDTGSVTTGMLKHLQELDGLYLESNYDEAMLQNSGRSFALISRIANRWGHLSNKQAAELIEQIATPKLQHLVLGHLSQDCNTPKLALINMQACLNKMGLATALVCASAAHRTPTIDIN